MAARHAPRVSILIPTYNYASFIGKALDSILAQDFTDFEVIISDDASADETESIIAPYLLQDQRIRYVRHPNNQGMVANWNWCLGQARGDYVKYLFADDMLACPQSLGVMVALLDTHPHAGLVACAREIINADGEIIFVTNDLGPDAEWQGATLIARCFLDDRNLLGEPSATLFRRDLATRGFDPDFRQLVDLEMWFHLARQAAVVYTRQALCRFRQHGAQQTVRNQGCCVARSENCRLFLSYLPYWRQQSAGWLARLEQAFLLFYYWRRLQKLADPTPDEDRLALQLQQQSGPLGLWGASIIYRLCRPIWNLCRSWRKRRFPASL